jgi:hypothetical protein
LFRRRPPEPTTRKSVYTYPRQISWLLPLVGYFLIIIALSTLFYRVGIYLKWSDLGVYRNPPPPWVIFPGGVPLVRDYLNSLSYPTILSVPLLWWVIQAIIGLLLALVFITFYNNLLPSLRVLDDHLEVRYATRWLPLPWTAISKIRSAEFAGGKWFVVLIEAEEGYLKPIHNLYALLFGSTAGPGVIVTSDIKGFEGLIKDVLGHRLDRYSPVRSRIDGNTAPTLDAVLVEDYFAAPLKLALEPRPSMGWLTGFSEGGIAPEAADENALEQPAEVELPPERLPITRGQAFGAAATLAVFPALIYLVDALMFGPYLLANATIALQLFFNALTLFVMALAEPLIGAGVIFAIGEIFTGRSDRELLKLELLAYPFVQLPRILVLTVALTLLVAHAGWLTMLIWFASVAWGAYLSVLFTMRLYPLKFDRAIFGGVATLVYSWLIILIYNTFHIWIAQ